MRYYQLDELDVVVTVAYAAGPATAAASVLSH